MTTSQYCRKDKNQIKLVLLWHSSTVSNVSLRFIFNNHTSVMHYLLQIDCTLLPCDLCFSQGHYEASIGWLACKLLFTWLSYDFFQKIKYYFEPIFLFIFWYEMKFKTKWQTVTCQSFNGYGVEIMMKIIWFINWLIFMSSKRCHERLKGLLLTVKYSLNSFWQYMSNYFWNAT
jgi:hypothetical protein